MLVEGRVRKFHLNGQRLATTLEPLIGEIHVLSCDRLLYSHALLQQQNKTAPGPIEAPEPIGTSQGATDSWSKHMLLALC